MYDVAIFEKSLSWVLVGNKHLQITLVSLYRLKEIHFAHLSVVAVASYYGYYFFQFHLVSMCTLKLMDNLITLKLSYCKDKQSQVLSPISYPKSLVSMKYPLYYER